MRNVKATVSGRTLTLVIDLDAAAAPSASGKSAVVASTEGNQSIDGLDPSYKLGLNFYRAVPKAPKA